MRLVAEFTTEPYHGEGTPPAHAQRSWDVIQAAGLPGDFGPLGTRFSGEVDEVLDTLRAVLAAAIEAGAQPGHRADRAGRREMPDPTHPLMLAIHPLVSRIGATVVDPTDLRTDDVPLAGTAPSLPGSV